MTEPSAFDTISGHPALDLVNTVANRLDRDITRELLPDADAVARWAHVVALPESASTAWKRALKHDADAPARVRAVREALHRLFVAVMDGKPLPAAALARIDAELRACRHAQRLSASDGGLAWDWTPEANAVDKLLLPVLTAAAELLASPDRARIKQCQGEGCGWLFLDRSKTGQRRWCSMRDCGNRAKARRHYQRAARAGD